MLRSRSAGVGSGACPRVFSGVRAAAASGFLAAALAAGTGAAAEGPYPEISSRPAAIAALQHPDPHERIAAVVYIARTGLAGDAPLLVERLQDAEPFVRELAEAGLWLLWSRSGDPEADRLLALGTEAMRAGRYDEAVEVLTRAIERRPDFAEAWNKRATTWYLAGELEKSLADCEQVVRRNPQHFGALAGFGQIYLRLERYERALDYFRRALAVNPNLGEVREVIRRIELYLEEQRRRAI
jgi:tetratricopeptide (TPR) repeat protein